MLVNLDAAMGPKLDQELVREFEAVARKG